MPAASGQRDTRTRLADSAAADSAKGWAAAHARCLLESLGRLSRRWVASALTILVIGIALALPSGLFVVVKNMDRLAGQWHQSVQISVYLDNDLAPEAGQQLADDLRDDKRVDKTQFVSAEQGLDEFKKASGFGAALDALGNNPLPGVIQVTPRANLAPAAVGELVTALGQRDTVAKASLDQAWLRRLTAILDLLSRASWVIGLLLSAAVVFIVGNTIRLDIENRRQEIEVMKLLGASDAFIRRPFLYSGLWYGLLGAFVALLVLGVCRLALGGSLATLVSSYDGALAIQGLGASGVLWLVVAGLGLGWVGCVITVNRELAAIEPH